MLEVHSVTLGDTGVQILDTEFQVGLDEKHVSNIVTLKHNMTMQVRLNGNAGKLCLHLECQPLHLCPSPNLSNLTYTWHIMIKHSYFTL